MMSKIGDCVMSIHGHGVQNENSKGMQSLHRNLHFLYIHICI